jgi:uracil-DNA glycosylase
MYSDQQIDAKYELAELQALLKQVLNQVDYLRDSGKDIYPAKEDVLNSVKYLNTFQDINVVIIGQDPYHGPGQAHGFSFSVPHGVKVPPSLRNVFKELKTDLEIENMSGNLETWAQQGVLLLNRILTVEKGKPKSHKGIGWEEYTESLIRFINRHCSDIVFMLWGNSAKSLKPLLTNPSFLVLEAAHPSPLSANAGFFECKHFSKANDFLSDKKSITIDWST